MRFIAIFFIIFNLIHALPEQFDKEKCNKCHEKYMDIQLLMKNFIEENNKLLNLKAPTGNELSFRLKQQIGSIEDMDFHLIETTDFVKDYVINPDKSKTICLEGVIRHFDTMPSLKGKISGKELEDVAFFLYFLEGFNDVNEFYHDETKF